ncbi:hypothetical protein [Roseomonas elaeocarpi]|uniref:Alcohol dehydrogenase GroES-associated domain-containing protein n=1 Tax=Roseomonas elaeocarpi TaxID=907779 RepID=A0ABV6JMD2_9PROT
MRAAVFHGVGDARRDSVPEPAIRRPTDATHPLVERVNNGSTNPTSIITRQEPMTDVIEAYRQFEQRRPDRIKVELNPAA